MIGEKLSVKIDSKKSKAKQRIRSLRGKYKHLNLMETLVEGRKQERHIPVPDWQKKLFDERQCQIKPGNAKFSDWESAKKRIRDRTS